MNGKYGRQWGEVTEGKWLQRKEKGGNEERERRRNKWTKGKDSLDLLCICRHFKVIEIVFFFFLLWGDRNREWGCMILVALWQLAWLPLSLASFSWPLAPSHTKYKQTPKTEPVNTHTCIASLSRVRLSELKASRAMWDVVTFYLITFSQAVMNVAAVLSTKAKTSLKHTVGTRSHTHQATDTFT